MARPRRRELAALDEGIGALRQKISQRAEAFLRLARALSDEPESVAFKGQAIARRFASRTEIDRRPLDVDSLVALLDALRDAIARQEEIRNVAAAKAQPKWKVLFRREEAAAELEISVSSVDELIATGTLRASKLGRRVLIHRKEIERLGRMKAAGELRIWFR